MNYTRAISINQNEQEYANRSRMSEKRKLRPNYSHIEALSNELLNGGPRYSQDNNHGCSATVKNATIQLIQSHLT